MPNCQLAERVEAKVAATLPSQKLAAFLNQSNLPTPFLVVDVDLIAEKYRSLEASLHPSLTPISTTPSKPTPPPQSSSA